MVLNILVQERRNREAAQAFLGRLVAGYPEEPRRDVPDKLWSDVPCPGRLGHPCGRRGYLGSWIP
jgi:transposase-like protein